MSCNASLIVQGNPLHQPIRPKRRRLHSRRRQLHGPSCCHQIKFGLHQRHNVPSSLRRKVSLHQSDRQDLFCHIGNDLHMQHLLPQQGHDEPHLRLSLRRPTRQPRPGRWIYVLRWSRKQRSFGSGCFEHAAIFSAFHEDWRPQWCRRGSSEMAAVWR